ncbi:MAG: hypothetical protein ACYC5Q_16500 [Thermoleophilia bacterium]
MDSLTERLTDIKITEKALCLAVNDALASHRSAGNPVAAYQDGKVVWIAPEDIRLPLER